MSTATLTIDLDAIAANWRALSAMAQCETAAVVKADGYGLGVGPVARALANAGARTFFVATAEEGGELRNAIGDGPDINIFSGHMAGDTDMIGDLALTPMLNSPEQLNRHLNALPRAPFGIQLNSGMNRLGMDLTEWAETAELALHHHPVLVMSHLACADAPDHAMNAQQLAAFHHMTDGISTPRSLAATGGILLGDAYHFDLTRPGIGLFGGAPYGGQSVTRLDLPVIQIRDIAVGESVGYGNTYTAETPRKIATISGGYADGLLRAMSGIAMLWDGATPCPLVGRVSMDLISVDVTDLAEAPRTLSILGPHQSVDDLAEMAGTIGYEILTSLGARYRRNYRGS